MLRKSLLILQERKVLFVPRRPKGFPPNAKQQTQINAFNSQSDSLVNANNPARGKLESKDRCGVVTRWWDKKGFGFIVAEEDLEVPREKRPQYFAHFQTLVITPNPNPSVYYRKGVLPDTKVLFDVFRYNEGEAPNKEQFYAMNVRSRDGSPLPIYVAPTLSAQETQYIKQQHYEHANKKVHASQIHQQKQW